LQRKEKEITDRDRIDKIIQGCHVCHLGLSMNNRPYVIPINFGYDGDRLYFHTSLKGKKIDCLEANTHVCFQMERDTHLVAQDPEPCKWSFAFESVIGFGKVRELISMEEKKAGLMHIIQHYATHANPPSDKRLAGVRVWCIKIEELTGKRSG
jgi:nitroimidazol reductase NimA-like FMN-containing flavoprotein (pyridoxamine 5'-phosphate oxidase superfamily)